MLDDVTEACGVIGLYGRGLDVARLAYYGLIAMQHRGQESAGIAVGDDILVHHNGGSGLVQQVIGEPELAGLQGHVAVGHVRYATAGGCAAANIQPLPGSTALGHDFALAHNGNLTGIDERTELSYLGGSARDGIGVADTQELVATLSEELDDVPGALRAVLPRVRGAFSIVVASPRAVYAARDPQGFRPLCLGRVDDGWMIASETVALESVGAVLVREVEAGELVTIDGDGPRAERFTDARPAPCASERIYFARQDSLMGGIRVQHMRHAMGRALAREAPAAADVVIPVPDTARPAAMGYAAATGPALRGGPGPQHVPGTDVHPAAGRRPPDGRAAEMNPLPEVVAGRRVAVVDDSIVRANSIREVVAMLRDAGAREVHVRVASPPVRWPCYFGVDKP